MSLGVKVKRVNPYPFDVQIKMASGVTVGQVVKLTLVGFLAEIAASTNLQPGDKLDVAFQIPVLELDVSEPCVVVKVYSQWGNGKPATPNARAQGGDILGPPPSVDGAEANGLMVVQLMELHFQNATSRTHVSINQFLRAIKAAT